MSKTASKVWNIVTWVLVAAVVLLAVLLAGVRIVGLKPYVVLSGSMEPTYNPGELIYVRDVDPFELESGDVITYMMDESTIVTHRVAGVVPDEDDSSVVRFRTKGDANDTEDGTLVHCRNIIGSPVLSIPYLGYVADYISHPPGLYIGIMVLCIILLAMFAPDLLRAADKADRKAAAEKARASEENEN